MGMLIKALTAAAVFYAAAASGPAAGAAAAGAALAAGHEERVSSRALFLFHALLTADKDFSPSKKQTLEKWLKKGDGRFAVKRLAGLMREMDIPLSEKPVLQRALNDFYTEKPLAERRALFKSGMGSAQSYLAEDWLPRQAGGQKTSHLVERPGSGFIGAFRAFVHDIKERYVVLNITAREREAIERFRKMLAERRGRAAAGRVRAAEISAAEIRHFRKVLVSLNIPSHAQNDALVMDYLLRFFGDIGAAQPGAGEKPADEGRKARAAEAEKNYYESLGAERAATQAEIKQAFRRAVQKHHPDRFPEGPAREAANKKTAEINEAYRVLKNEAKRAEYDMKSRASEAAAAIKDPSVRDTDRSLWEILRNVKAQFDQTHYSRLREQGKIWNMTKGFTPQFAGFLAAHGASIFTKKYTDPFLYGLHKNPGELDQIIESMSDLPNFAVHTGSFFLFVAASQKTNTWLYGRGMKFDSRALRSIAPVAGLLTGFSVSHAATQLFYDENVRKCFPKAFADIWPGGEESQYDLEHLTPCEQAYLTWWEGHLWGYGIDLLLMAGSFYISHLLIERLLQGVRWIPGGAFSLAAAARAIGPRITGWAGFFATIYLFMKTHYVADSIVGKNLKEWLAYRDIKHKMIEFHSLYKDFDGREEASKEGFIRYVKVIGHKFLLWAGAKANDYAEPLKFWTKNTEKIEWDYKRGVQYLKLLSESAAAPYGAHFEDKDETEPLRGIKNAPVFFDERKIDSNYKEAFFPYVSQREDLRAALLEKSAVCLAASGSQAGESENISIEGRDQEILYTVYYYLHEGMGHLKIPSMSEGEAAAYLGAGHDELFSPSAGPVSELPSERQWSLAARLLDGYFCGDPELYYGEAAAAKAEEGFCRYIYPPEGQKELYEDCLSKGEMAPAAAYFLSNKLLAGSLYLLREIRAAGFEIPQFAAHPELQLARFLRLASFAEAYKKGEGVFEAVEREAIKKRNALERQIDAANMSIRPQLRKEMDSLKKYRLASPYIFFRGAICGSSGGGGAAEGQLFSPPALFDIDGLDSLCQDAPEFAVKDGAWETDPESRLAFRRFLFGRPVHLMGESYESLWLALEAYVRKYFPNEKSLMALFEAKSGEPLDRAAGQALDNLDFVTEEYFIPSLTNPLAAGRGKTCESLLAYYDEEKAQSFPASFLESFKGLEIYIFQTLFWMKRLKDLKLSEAAAAAPERPADIELPEGLYHKPPFSEAAYDKALCQAAGLMQSYHDAYAGGYGGIFPPEKAALKEIEGMMYPAADYELLQAMNETGALLVDPAWDPVEELKALYSAEAGGRPIWTPWENIVFSVLQKSYPDLNKAGYRIAFEANFNAVPEDRKAVFALIFQMRRSLAGFFAAAGALRAREEAIDLPRAAYNP